MGKKMRLSTTVESPSGRRQGERAQAPAALQDLPARRGSEGVQQRPRRSGPGGRGGADPGGGGGAALQHGGGPQVPPRALPHRLGRRPDRGEGVGSAAAVWPAPAGHLQPARAADEAGGDGAGEGGESLNDSSGGYPIK